jgi:hypothetical protein
MLQPTRVPVPDAASWNLASFVAAKGSKSLPGHFEDASYCALCDEHVPVRERLGAAPDVAEEAIGGIAAILPDDPLRRRVEFDHS